MLEIKSQMNNSALPPTRDESAVVEDTKVSAQYPLFIAGSFLVFMLLVTGYYYWTNYQAQKVLDGIYAEKAGYDSQIQVLKSNPEILAAEILLTKEDELKKTIEQSNPAIYLRELERIYKAKGIVFEGFSYTKGKVSTRMIAQSGADEDAVKKVIALIAEYRKADSNTSLFSLGPVLSVSGDSGERTVNIEFTIR